MQERHSKIWCILSVGSMLLPCETPPLVKRETPKVLPLVICRSLGASPVIREKRWDKYGQMEDRRCFLAHECFKALGTAFTLT